jgi:hypothetical protein
MPSSRGFLERFRPSGTPGAAAGAGVPADRVAEREVELAGLFEQLADVEQAAARIRAEGRQLAEQRRAAGITTSRRMLADARQNAESERRSAAGRIATLADRESSATLEEAEREAAAIRAHAQAVLPRYVERVVDEVRRQLRIGEEPAERQ